MAASAATLPAGDGGINRLGDMELGVTPTPEATLLFHNSYSSASDWKVDNQVKTVSIFRIVDGEVLGLDPGDKTKFMSLVPNSVSTIKEPQQKYLCIEYGPKKKPQYLYLDFTNSGTDELSNWEEAIKRTLPRKSSSTVSRSKTVPHRRGHKPVNINRRSALQPTGFVKHNDSESADNQLASTPEVGSPEGTCNQEETIEESNEVASPESQRPDNLSEISMINLRLSNDVPYQGETFQSINEVASPESERTDHLPEIGMIDGPLSEDAPYHEKTIQNSNEVSSSESERTDHLPEIGMIDGPLSEDTPNQEETPLDSNGTVSSDGERVNSDVSSPGSLHSMEEDNESPVQKRLRSLQKERDEDAVEMEIERNYLSSVDVRLADYGGSVFVGNLKLLSGQTDPPHCLYIGDQIVEIDHQPVVDARSARENIKSLLTKDPKDQINTSIKLKLRRFPNGHMCVINNNPIIHTEERCDQLGITLHGSTITEMTPGKAFRNACDPGRVTWAEAKRVDKAITSINGRPVSLRESSVEVRRRICDACAVDTPLVFHVHPITFLKALSSKKILHRQQAVDYDDADLEEVPGMSRNSQRQNELLLASQGGNTADVYPSTLGEDGIPNARSEAEVVDARLAEVPSVRGESMHSKTGIQEESEDAIRSRTETGEAVLRLSAHEKAEFPKVAKTRHAVYMPTGDSL